MVLRTDIQLSKNFNMREFLGTNTGLDNTPSWQEFPLVENKLKDLVYNVLQPARDHFGKPMQINSGFRNEAVNKRVRGVSNSQHRLGEAADIEIYGVDNLELADWLVKNTTFDQLILEDYSGDNSGWVHVSYRAGRNRKDVRNAPDPRSGKTYSGLPRTKSEAVWLQAKEGARVEAPGYIGLFGGLGLAAFLFWKGMKK